MTILLTVSICYYCCAFTQRVENGRTQVCARHPGLPPNCRESTIIDAPDLSFIAILLRKAEAGKLSLAICARYQVVSLILCDLRFNSKLARNRFVKRRGRLIPAPPFNIVASFPSLFFVCKSSLASCEAPVRFFGQLPWSIRPCGDEVQLQRQHQITT